MVYANKTQGDLITNEKRNPDKKKERKERIQCNDRGRTRLQLGQGGRFPFLRG